MSTIYIYNKTSIKQTILTIKQHISGSRWDYELISTPVHIFKKKLKEINRTLNPGPIYCGAVLRPEVYSVPLLLTATLLQPLYDL